MKLRELIDILKMEKFTYFNLVNEMIKRDFLIDLLKELEPDQEIECSIYVDQDGVFINKEFTITFKTSNQLKL